MREKILMMGNEAIAEAAIVAGCRHYYGYPITPQNEIPNYISRRLEELGGTFIQSESELAAVNMVFGTGLTGTRAMTSSSSPGISLKQEGISYLAAAEVPAVIVNIMRGGPGLGGIGPSQSDYFQAVKGGGHGDYHSFVFAPSSVQESVDVVIDAFDIADKYRTPVMILGDGILGQLMEPVVFPKMKEIKNERPKWALTGCKGRKPNVIRSLFLDPYVLENLNKRLEKKYDKWKKDEVRYEEYCVKDADILFVAYGTLARICKAVVRDARKEGIKAGLIRPITLFPFPEEALKKSARGKKFLLVVEMSMGQMLEDVKLAIGDSVPIHFYSRTGGVIITPDEVYGVMKKYLKKK